MPRPLTPMLSREEVGRLARSQLEHLYMEMAIQLCKMEQRVNELEAGKDDGSARMLDQTQAKASEALDDSSKKKHNR